uniref:Transglutaminase n=1 Tax=Thermogemmatispora argillosa TaxID=2045280 RepID=A0A455T3J5_9CHLR|nr:transglutaminase [Thermogemmatispora argillosa]
MGQATADRFSRLFSPSEPSPKRANSPAPNKPGLSWSSLRELFRLEEGYFSLVLVTVVVYSTIWSVQVAGWVAHLEVLTLTTALGLLLGLLAVRQRWLSPWLVQPLALVFGLFIAYWQTATADFNGSFPLLFAALRAWLVIALAGGTSSDDSIFLFLITALSFWLAYASVWLVYRTRLPLLMILLNGAVLLINLSNVPIGYLIFLFVFLCASLLLLLRFSLFESMRRWKRLGLRCADDLGWDFMQAGLLVSLAVVILSWILPGSYVNAEAAQIWDLDSNPWVQVENAWNRLIAVNGGVIPSNRGNFTNSLVLGGNPHLNNDVVFRVTSSEGGQYIASLAYDTYDGRGWSTSPTYGISLPKGQQIPPEGTPVHVVTLHITVVNPPGEQQPYLFTPWQAGQLDQPAVVLVSKNTTSIVAVLRKGSKLAAGDRYTVQAYVSSADVKTLESVPFPSEAPKLPSNYEGPLPTNYYDPAILQTYLQLPPHLDPNIRILAEQITANAHTMYDKAVALENYFRSYTYSVDVQLPPGDEPVSWLLFRSGHRAFCNYFATAMAVMARELGMPARVVTGYAPGDYDAATHQWIVRGTQAHAWTQIYFAGYGWINFEPSPGFPAFTRPQPNQYSSSTNNSITAPGQGGSAGAQTPPRLPLPNDESQATGGGTQEGGLSWQQSLSYFALSVVFVLACLLMLFTIWWRRLFRHLRLTAQIYGRICLLASWAGLSLRRAETPNEYIQRLTHVAPEQAPLLQRLGDLYVRDLWAPPGSPEHPASSGEMREAPALWRQVEPRLFLYLLRHPHILGRIPVRLGRWLWERLRRLWRGGGSLELPLPTPVEDL